VRDVDSLGLAALQQGADEFAGKGTGTPGLLGMFSSFRSDTPQLFVDVDRAKCKTMGVSLQDVFLTLQLQLGGYYVNDFNQFGRTWQVNLQGDAAYRLDADQVGRLRVRSATGAMVPLGAVAEVIESQGPALIVRYDGRTAASVNGLGAPGTASAEVVKTVEGLAKDVLPSGLDTSWTELTLLQIQAGNTALAVFGVAVILVFLVLAAQYESLRYPLAVILVVPMCLLCALVGVFLRKLPMDIFVQIGFVVLVGLACKNAILIIEFAKHLHESGLDARSATVEACHMRLRPILMTSLAFILGVVPMVVASGAGAEMRWSLGTAVFSGMIGVTFFGIFLTPVFFYIIVRASEFSLLKSKAVRQIGSAVMGGGVGLAGGWLAHLVGFKHLHWALVGGFALGLLIAVFVSSRKSKRISKKSLATVGENRE